MRLNSKRPAFLVAIALCLAFAAISCKSTVIQQGQSTRGQRAGAAQPMPHDFARWEKEIAAYEAADQANPPPKRAILFIGSSTIRLWATLKEDFPQHKVINRGFGGSEIADSTYFADRLVLPYAPRLVVLYAGGNDLNSGKTP